MTIVIRNAAAALAVFGVVAAGCATAPPPADFDPAQTRLEIAKTAPKLDVSSLPGGKGVGAGVGAASGLGWGTLAGAAGCVATGPFIAICLAAVMPITMGVGAGTGAIVGAARTESVDAVQVKTRALAQEIQATPLQAQFARQLRDELQGRGAGTLPIAGSSGEADPVVGRSADVGSGALNRAVPSPRPWTLEADISEVATEGNDEFRLRLVAVVRLRRDGGTIAWQGSRDLESHTELTIGQWMSNEAAPLHSVAAACIKTAAEQLAGELVRALPRTVGAPARPPGRSSRCDDVPQQSVNAASAV